MVKDILGLLPLKNCPSKNTVWLTGVYYPMNTFILSTLCMTTLSLALFIGWKLNNVRVFNRRIRTTNISNTLWIYYFILVSLKSGLEAFRYATGMVDDFDLNYNIILQGSSALVEGIMILLLNLSLNHQRKYRSTGNFCSFCSFSS